MNREKVQALIDRLKKVPDTRFNMRWWLSRWDGVDHRATEYSGPIECGTAGCLAGHVVMMMDKGVLRDVYEQDVNDRGSLFIMRAAQQELELTRPQASALFCPRVGTSWSLISLRDITKQQAINTLEHLLSSNEVNWLAANPADTTLFTQSEVVDI